MAKYGTTETSRTPAVDSGFAYFRVRRRKLSGLFPGSAFSCCPPCTLHLHISSVYCDIMLWMLLSCWRICTMSLHICSVVFHICMVEQVLKTSLLTSR